jgi:hypothetical protein
MLENALSSLSNPVHAAKCPLRDTAEVTAGVSFQSEQAANWRVCPVLQQPPSTAHSANRLAKQIDARPAMVDRKKVACWHPRLAIPLLQHIEIVVPRIRQVFSAQVQWQPYSPKVQVFRVLLTLATSAVPIE